jgi:WD40 repeat protein
VFYKEKNIIFAASSKAIIYAFSSINGSVVATLIGHLSPIGFEFYNHLLFCLIKVRLHLDSYRKTLISVSSDKVIKVWDIKNYTILQVLVFFF